MKGWQKRQGWLATVGLVLVIVGALLVWNGPGTNQATGLGPDGASEARLGRPGTSGRESFQPPSPPGSRREISAEPGAQGAQAPGPNESGSPTTRLRVRVWKHPLEGERVPLSGARVLATAVDQRGTPVRTALEPTGGQAAGPQEPSLAGDVGSSSPHPRRSQPTDDAGLAIIDGLAMGRYRLQLDPSTLPAGFRPPLEIDTGSSFRPEFSMRVVDCDRVGTDQTVDLAAYPKLRLAGRVVAPEGCSLEGWRVLITPRGGGSMRAMQSIEVDGQGMFETDEVFAIPYVVNLVVPRLGGGQGRRAPACHIAPPPQFVTLRHGSLHDLEFELGGGGLRVKGRVVDEEGQGMFGVPVLAYYHDGEVLDFRYSWLQQIGRVVTDEQGAFELAGLSHHPFRVQVDPQGAKRGLMGTRRLKRVPAVIDVTREQLMQTIDLGSIQVERMPLYQVEGVLVAQGPGGAERVGSLPAGRLEAELLPAEAGREAPFVEFDRRSGEFSVACDASAQGLILRWVSHRGTVMTEWSWSPTPGQVEEGVRLSLRPSGPR